MIIYIQRKTSPTSSKAGYSWNTYNSFVTAFVYMPTLDREAKALFVIFVNGLFSVCRIWVGDGWNTLFTGVNGHMTC